LHELVGVNQINALLPRRLNNMKLRILEILDGNGEKRYRVQKRWLWMWFTVTMPGESCVHVYEFCNLATAKERMQSLLKKSNSKRVVQKNIICGGDVVGGDVYKS
jgi:hypothetical protein